MVHLQKDSFRYIKFSEHGEKLDADAGWQDGVRTVGDLQTGLCWEMKSPQAQDFNFSGHRLSWDEFYGDYIKGLNQRCYGGFSDWRVPLKSEIRMLIHYDRIAPAFAGNIFGVNAAEYWCGACAYGMRPDCGWTIDCNIGAATVKHKSLPSYCIAVRGECRLGRRDRFKDNGDGTITDEVTGLMW